MAERPKGDGMREIKFRVWDGESMLSLSKAISIGLVVIQDDEADSFVIEPDYDQVELMQYTGLKDKNGVEVYEGDVLFVADGYVYEIIFDEDIGSFRGKGTGENMYGCDNCNVIGNIYENPELLEK